MMFQKKYLSDFPPAHVSPFLSMPFNTRLIDGVSVPFFGDFIASVYSPFGGIRGNAYYNDDGYMFRFFEFGGVVAFLTFKDTVFNVPSHSTLNGEITFFNSNKNYFDNVGKYSCGFSVQNLSFFDSLDDAVSYGLASLYNTSSDISYVIQKTLSTESVRTENGGDIYVDYFVSYQSFRSINICVYPSCCPLDYSPIVRLLGGIPA